MRSDESRQEADLRNETLPVEDKQKREEPQVNGLQPCRHAALMSN